MGPCFNGGNESELEVVDPPFNSDGNCCSNTYRPGFDIPKDGNGFNMLTNREDGNFKISEIEVWKVKFIEE